jgi:aryl-alcohol dehydrogenase-like predicted oxidoreductase
MNQVFFPVSSTAPDAIAVGQDEDSHGFVNQHGLSRKHIFDSVKHSLRRLQLDYVDVLQCHRFDNSAPIEETMQALHDVVQAGYARYIGMSSCYAWQCEWLVRSRLLKNTDVHDQSGRCKLTPSRID